MLCPKLSKEQPLLILFLVPKITVRKARSPAVNETSASKPSPPKATAVQMEADRMLQPYQLEREVQVEYQPPSLLASIASVHGHPYPLQEGRVQEPEEQRTPA